MLGGGAKKKHCSVVQHSHNQYTDIVIEVYWNDAKAMIKVKGGPSNINNVLQAAGMSYRSC